jgi:hypothetical protein
VEREHRAIDPKLVGRPPDLLVVVASGLILPEIDDDADAVLALGPFDKPRVELARRDGRPPLGHEAIADAALGPERPPSREEARQRERRDERPRACLTRAHAPGVLLMFDHVS